MLPVALVANLFIRLVSPFLQIRITSFNASRIGHMVGDVESMLCEMDLFAPTKGKKTIDFWVPWTGNLPVGSKFALKVWKQNIRVAPRFFFGPVETLNLLLPDGSNYSVPSRKGDCSKLSQEHDVLNSFAQTKPHFLLSPEQLTAGKEFVKRWGLDPDKEFVCLLVRDSAFHRITTGSKWFDHPHRNIEIGLYEKTVDYLLSSGYNVFRMGVHAVEPLSKFHSRSGFIDLPFHEDRCELVDIYLSSSCKFFMSTGAGLDSVALAHRVPVLHSNISDLRRSLFLTHKTLSIFRRPRFCEIGDEISLQSFFDSNLHCLDFDQIAERGIEFVANSEDEILEATVELEQMIENFQFDEEPLIQSELQKKFIEMTPDFMKEGKVRGLISDSFLKRHQYLVQ